MSIGNEPKLRCSPFEHGLIISFAFAPGFAGHQLGLQAGDFGGEWIQGGPPSSYKWGEITPISRVK